MSTTIIALLALALFIQTAHHVVQDRKIRKLEDRVNKLERDSE